MDEITLGKLSRAQLHKVAKDHGVRANMQSVVIIRELLKLSKAVPALQDEESEEPPRKKAKTTEERHPAAGPSTRTVDLPADTSFDAPTPKTPIKAAGRAGGIAPDNLGRNSPSLPEEPRILNRGQSSLKRTPKAEAKPLLGPDWVKARHSFVDDPWRSLGGPQRRTFTWWKN
ncbi:hypothetical protein CY34DRAFT_17313 [Suillus luteus UH-Slu-Lm8-n1]|uniref:Uncharacterized protein n=1 Tax=Suillus luteus UH-Slu-Lm8-n1 TaxID=930992 RepID=A0A0C9ZC03_9AGAM|nr:hypothetical protein CY34DRAFT_17313 [Suillus luteus UH-Slu-Lm8-n1]